MTLLYTCLVRSYWSVRDGVWCETRLLIGPAFRNGLEPNSSCTSVLSICKTRHRCVLLRQFGDTWCEREACGAIGLRSRCADHHGFLCEADVVMRISTVLVTSRNSRIQPKALGSFEGTPTSNKAYTVESNIPSSLGYRKEKSLSVIQQETDTAIRAVLIFF